MKTSTNRAIETFLLITFPLALFAGCAGNGDLKTGNEQAMAQDAVKSSQADDTSDNPLTASTMQLLADTLKAEEMRISAQSDETQNQENPFSEDQKATLDGHAAIMAQNTPEITSGEPAAPVSEIAQMDSPEPAASVANQNDTITSATNDDGFMTAELKSPSGQQSGGNMIDVKLQAKSINTAAEPQLHIINFATNKTDVEDSYVAILEQHARFLKANPGLTLTISGHSDKRGSNEYNEKLSLQRAQSVYDILLSYGVPDDQLIVDSYGETSPLHSENNYQENRRVELEYLDSGSIQLSAR